MEGREEREREERGREGEGGEGERGEREGGEGERGEREREEGKEERRTRERAFFSLSSLDQSLTLSYRENCLSNVLYCTFLPFPHLHT